MFDCFLVGGVASDAIHGVSRVYDDAALAYHVKYLTWIILNRVCYLSFHRFDWSVNVLSRFCLLGDMLKLFVVSDLHGRFPDSLREAVLEEEPDAVVCCGDIAPFRLRDEFFEYMYGTRSDDSEKRLWDYIGKARYKAETKKDVADARGVLAALDDLPFPVRFVPGNVDRTIWEQETSGEKSYPSTEWDWVQQDFLHSFTEDLLGVKDVSYGADAIGNYVFIGYPVSNFPGDVQSDPYRRHRRWLDNAFGTFEWKKHRDKEVIFVCHNGPYETDTDLIESPDADDRVIEQHYGSKLARRIIERYQPRLCVHGHIEEGRGTDMIGDTKIVNVGEGRSGSHAVIEVVDDIDVSLRS